MVEYALLKLIDNNPELFRKISQNYYNPLSSYIDMKLYDYKDFPLYGLREIKYKKMDKILYPQSPLRAIITGPAILEKLTFCQI